MKLPNAAQAIVPEAKLTRYLLDPKHRVGKDKARVFTARGFTLENWRELEQALLQLALDGEVASTELTEFGRKYTIEGSVLAPDGHSFHIRTGWIIRPGSEAPTLVTAFGL